MVNVKNRRYLGSKTKLIPFIKQVVDENCHDVKTVVDLFSGTGSVAWEFNNDNKRVIINDILESNYLTYLAFFSNLEYDKNKIKNLIIEYNDLKNFESNYFSINFSDTYFSETNCLKIGHIREDIENKYINKTINLREKAILITSLLYAMDKIANTVGHYDAFRKNGNLKKDLVLDFLDIPDNSLNDNNQIFKLNANELVKKIEADLFYIDPPYNSRQYCDAYHLLENVAEWKKLTVQGEARKIERLNIKSNYCTNKAPLEFSDLVANIKAKYIVVSYNNMGNKGANRSQAKISEFDIINILKSRGEVEVFEKDFKPYTTGKSKITNHKEKLYLCKVDKKKSIKIQNNENIIENVKSPLNYTGGKFKLLPQLINKFPTNIGTFVDLFGGGFNVGVNAIGKLHIYNDSQKQVTNLIKLFYKYNHIDLIKEIENIISKFNLSNSYVNGYEFYNSTSDSGLGKFNKKGFENLRDFYNNLPNKNSDDASFLLLVLIIFSFNNLIRFNSKGFFNSPVGKRDFNYKVRENLKKFSLKLKQLNLQVENKDFKKLDLTKYKDCFVYCDPPYLIGLASYNENNNWNQEKEKELLNFLDSLNSKGIKFALSNVIEHKNSKNEILSEWLKKRNYKTHYINSNYNNSSYQLKNKKPTTIEILVTNY